MHRLNKLYLLCEKNDYVLRVSNFSAPTPTKYLHNFYIKQFAYNHYALRETMVSGIPALNL